MGPLTSTLSQQYFSWLYAQVENRRPKYRKLCASLHTRQFLWTVPNDDNRCQDGLNLRDTFVEENNLNEDHLEVRYFLKGENCTILELLVALALRMNDQLYDLKDRTNHTSKWYLELITNLNLDQFTDDSTPDDWFDSVTEMQIDKIISVLVSRNYGFEGRGGLFPLKRRPREDQKRVEIWYQMALYLDENYGL